MNPFDDLQDMGMFLIVFGFLGVLMGLFTSGVCCIVGTPMIVVGVVLVIVEAMKPKTPRHWPTAGGPGGSGFPPPAPRTPFCSTCGRPSLYIAQYQRYYCTNCNRYLPEHAQPPGGSRP